MGVELMKNRRRFRSVDRLCGRWQQRYLREGHGAQLTARPVPALIHAGIHSAKGTSYAAPRAASQGGHVTV